MSVDSLSFRLDELTDLDAQALAQSLFLYEEPKAPTYERAFWSVCQYFPRSAPPLSQPLQLLNTLLT